MIAVCSYCCFSVERTFPFVKYQGGLHRRSLSLFRLRNRRDEFGLPSAFDDLLGRLPRLVQFPMPARALVRRVEDRLFEKRISQVDTPPEITLMRYRILRVSTQATFG